jgi:hypothetical protein
MIQQILDLYPDSISQYGLLGCYDATFLPPLFVWAVYYIARKVIRR